jgi:Zn-dependent protease with chaperone function
MAFDFLYGQDFKDHIVKITPSEEPVSGFENAAFVESVFKELEPLEKDRDLIEKYAVYCLQNRLNIMSTNKEYDNWTEGEKYLETVCQKLAPPGGFNRSIKIRLVRDPSINASAYEDGYIYVNVGLLANISSEAELASVLAHEIGHVVLHHNFSLFKSYSNYAAANSIGKLTGGLTGFLIKKLALSNLSEHSISDEEDADTYAIQLIKTSMYTHHGMLNLFMRFQKQSDLLDSRARFSQQKRYFKTHPTNKARINKIKKSFPQETGSRDFLVDSAYFMKLKRQCIDESIYLLFSRLEFEDCLEESYLQHLEYPKDNFYLFFLENSLDRLLKEDPALANKRFITNRYVLNNTSKIPAPKKIYSRFYKDKPAEFVYRQSIFYNLSHIYGLGEEEGEKLKNLELVNNDTLEFINYEDALNYFQKVSIKNNCKICPIHTSNEKNESSETAGDNMLEHQLYRISGELKDFLANADNYNKKIFIINRYAAYYITDFDFGKTTQSNIGNIYSLIQSNNLLREQNVVPQQLDFDERSNLLQYLEKIQDHLPDPGETSTSKFKVLNKKYFSCREIFPELSVMLNHHKANKINFLSVNKIQKNTGGYMNLLIQLYDYVINCYSIDLKNNTICKFSENLGEVSDQEILENAEKAFSEMNRQVAKPNSQ